ncbi:LppM family (lipo)protein [Micromonospora sp. NPDC000316]|uniref:LppM family (lipo)protein n=1 Tax=Micromonospora sp. NPDC000316 TaxID=3364216 RepID=UPI0036937205
MNSRVNRGKALRVAVCLLLLAALSGCMRLNIGLTVNADDTVDGQLLLAAPKNLLRIQNRNIPAAFAQLRQNIPALPPGEETPYEDSELFGTQINYRRAPLAGFDSESVKLVRDDNFYRFTLSLDPKKYGGKIAQQDPKQQEEFLRLMSFEISVTFPGSVIDTNGTVNGRSVTWKVDSNQGKPGELQAVAEAPPRPSVTPVAAAEKGGLPWLLIVGGLLLVLVLAAVGVLLLRRRRPTALAPAGPQPTPLAPAGPEPTAPGAPASTP